MSVLKAYATDAMARWPRPRTWPVAVRLRRVLLALAVLALAWPVEQGLSVASAQPSGRQALEKLTLVTASGRHAFLVEVMRTREELAQGLMFRRTMAKNRGMLFDFGKVQPVAMWMRNTYLPLDMIFIDKSGVIANIAENTEPLSEETIVSERPVLSVLEVNAGTARRLGLKAGDRVIHPIFRRR